MNNLPFYIYFVFGLTLLATVWLFYKATKASSVFLMIIGIWVTFQSILSVNGFYKITDTIPPRLPLLVLPPVIVIIILFNTNTGKTFIDGLNLKALSLLHIIRIPVEVVLFWLYVHKAIPALMTFEGRNFDILAGIAAPLIYYFGFVKNKLSKPILLVWNFICLGLLLNIVFNSVLSAPTRFQQFAFEQPNIALGYFPFALLPAVIVPLVLLSHLVAIRQLMLKKIKSNI